MNLNITSRNFELTSAIKDYVTSKLAPLEKLNVIMTSVDVEIHKNTHHKRGDVFFMRINITIPKDFIHVEEVGEDLYAVIDLCKEEVERGLRKYKTKFEAIQRRAQKSRRSLKSIFKFWS